MKIAVTGATGYIGEHFVKRALVEGHEIISLSRRQPWVSINQWIPYQLSSNHSPALPANTDVLVHLATTTFADKHHGTQEILAAGLLIKAAQAVDAKFIFVSSQAARQDAPTAYGQTKWGIEQLVLAAGGYIVRPGQVYGGLARGLFGELVKIVQRLPVLPAFLPAPKVQPIHVDDLAVGLLRIAERADISAGILCLGSPEPVPFTDFLRAIATYRLRLWRAFLPIPTLIIYASIQLIGKQTGLGRLRSLFDLPVMATQSDLSRLQLRLRPLAAGMHPAGQNSRRYLFIEARVLFSYVLRAKPGNAVLRRYVHAIEKLRDGRALSLPKPFVQWPVLLALIDDGNRTKTIWGNEFVWRLDAATLLAEATPLGARRFLGLGEAPIFIKAVFRVTHAVLAEAGWRLLSVLVAPLLRTVLPRSLGEQQ